MRKKNKTGWRERPLHDKDSFPFKPWLGDRGSLTERLQAAGPFSVVVLKQQTAAPTLDEARELSLKRKQIALIREVALFCNGRPVVFAHTVLPRQPRGPLTRWLTRLGNRPLGALLFALPRFSRGRLDARRLDARHPLFHPSVEALQLAGKPPKTLWARRSSFSFGRQSVLVTEVFSPAISKFPSTQHD